MPSRRGRVSPSGFLHQRVRGRTPAGLAPVASGKGQEELFQILGVQARVAAEKALLESEPTLQRAIALRNPYVDPMNLMQVDLLQRWRASDRQDRDLFDGLLASIGGIAQGLQSTG